MSDLLLVHMLTARHVQSWSKDMNVNTSSNTCMLIHTRQPKSWFNLGGGGGSEGNIALLSVLSAS